MCWRPLATTCTVHCPLRRCMGAVARAGLARPLTLRVWCSAQASFSPAHLSSAAVTLSWNVIARSNGTPSAIRSRVFGDTLREARMLTARRARVHQYRPSCRSSHLRASYFATPGCENPIHLGVDGVVPSSGVEGVVETYHRLNAARKSCVIVDISSICARNCANVIIKLITHTTRPGVCVLYVQSVRLHSDWMSLHEVN